MPRPRHDSVVFTVVVTALVSVGALVILVVLALSGAPSTLLLATLLAALPVGPLVACYLWLDRYEPEPRRLLAYGLLWGVFVATAAALLIQGIGGFFVGFTENVSLAVVAPDHRGGQQGALPAAPAVVAPGRARRRARRRRLCRHGRHRLRVHREHPLPRGGVRRPRRPRPGRHRGVDRHLRRPVPAEPVRAPLLHRLHRHRGRHRGRLAPVLGAGARAAGRLCRRRRAPRRVERLDRLRPRELRRPSTVCSWPRHSWRSSPSLVWARRSERRMLTAALGDAAARGLIPATDIGWVVDLRARRLGRAYARQHGGKAGERAMRDYQQAAIELGFLHHRFLRGTPPPDFAARGQDHVARIGAVRPYDRIPRTGGPDPMTERHGDPQPPSTQMLTSLVMLRGSLQDARLPLDVPGVEEHRKNRSGGGRPARGLRHPADDDDRRADADRRGRLHRRRQVHLGQLDRGPSGHRARRAAPHHPVAGAGAPPR